MKMIRNGGRYFLVAMALIALVYLVELTDPLELRDSRLLEGNHVEGTRTDLGSENLAVQRRDRGACPPMDFRGRARLLAHGEMDGTRFAALRSNARRPQANGQHRRRVRGEGTYLPDKRDRRRSSG